ncbi:hypothetical protein [Natronobacterium gregoryi]|uniref:Uncharacterized protein n=2 Tax=Natronobacterium gregoryi TaxID=44930 RepID=L0ALK9_NATGS|nr:hypothetical protein [Natronobacterium gregoryi]AFZ74072.1 hypothetical protein Natgr_2934 [Natronobacterium gregoryi SP2]ELY70373.1 hypothetical protein C490_06694 [Natronobacterium gregoryi SP2]SFJ06258.1 hypothetical protein SAMN05443661_1138 [Natronobacterium gregoryi]
MLRSLLDRLRKWWSVDDPEERIEGSGEPIVSPKHRRAPEAEQALDPENHQGEDDRNP